MMLNLLNFILNLLTRIKKKYFIDYHWEGQHFSIDQCNLVEIDKNKNAIDYYKKVTKKFYGPEDVEIIGRHGVLPVLASTFEKKILNILEFGGSSNPVISYLIKTCNHNFISTVIEKKQFIERFRNKVPAKYNSSLQYKESVKDLDFNLFDICYFGSSIQYIENYKEILTKIFQSKIKYIVITETFFNYTDYDFFVSAIRDNPNYLANRFFSYKKFFKLFKKNNYECIYENKKDTSNHKHKTINYKNYYLCDLIFKRINF